MLPIAPVISPVSRPVFGVSFLATGSSAAKISFWPRAAASSAGRLLPVKTNSPRSASALALASASLARRSFSLVRRSISSCLAFSSSVVCCLSSSSAGASPSAGTGAFSVGATSPAFVAVLLSSSCISCSLKPKASIAARADIVLAGVSISSLIASSRALKSSLLVAANS